MTEQPILEVVVFRVKAGIADAEFLREAGVAQAWIEKQPGFVSRELLKAADDQWIDTVRWESMELAHKAAESIMNSDHCRPFMGMIDEAGVQIFHATPQALAAMPS